MELLWHVFFLYFQYSSMQMGYYVIWLHSLYLHRLPCSQPSATVGVIAFNQSISELIMLTKIIPSLVIRKEIVYWLHKGIQYIATSKYKTKNGSSRAKYTPSTARIGVEVNLWKPILCGLALDRVCCTGIFYDIVFWMLANVKINKLIIWLLWPFSKLQFWPTKLAT